MLAIVFFADAHVGLSALKYACSVREKFGTPRAVVGLPGSDVEQFARESGLPFVAWDRADLAGVAVQVRAFQPDIVYLAWWPDILREPFLDLGQKFTLNMHPSLLPHCRGKDPNFWALKDNRPFGVTIHHVVRDVDAGDIAFQRRIDLSWTDNGESAYRRALDEMLSLFRETYPFVAQGSIPRKPQPDGGSFHKRSHLEPSSLIDLDAEYKARDLLNLLRARTFGAHPACYFWDDGKVYEARLSIREDGNGRRST